MAPKPAAAPSASLLKVWVVVWVVAVVGLLVGVGDPCTGTVSDTALYDLMEQEATSKRIWPSGVEQPELHAKDF